MVGLVEAGRKGVVRLVVSAPNGRTVLARPNGLAGWTLPAMPAEVPFEHWDDRARAQAAAIVGGSVEPVRMLAPDAWAVVPAGRISAVGSTWIDIDDAARLGADETIVRLWYATAAGDVPGG